MILTITDGKTLSAGDTDYTGILRHKDPVLCPIAFLAFYLLCDSMLHMSLYLTSTPGKSGIERDYS